MTTISVRTLTAAVQARLADAVTDAQRYTSEADKVPLIPDSDGRAVAYYVLHPTSGSEDGELDLGDTVTAIDWGIQVTCAAGYVLDLQALVDRVHAAMYRWEPTVDGLVCGPFRPPPGYSAPFLLDRDVTPHRPYVPLQYVAPITAA